MQIHELASLSTALASGTYFAVDNGSVTRKLNYSDLRKGVFNSYSQSPGYRNSIYRGTSLGTSITSAQSSAISNGTFDDMFVGDYWTINGVTWRIADIDPYYRCCETALPHHVAVIPDTSLYTAAFNATNDTSTGYVASAIRENIKGTDGSASGAEAKFKSAFGNDHVLSYRNMYPTTYDSNGNATAFAWADACVELMNEIEAYGTNVWSNSGYEVGLSKRQFALFRLSPRFLNIRTSYWLRTIRSATSACVVNYYGVADGYAAGSSYGVRPFALIV